MIYLKHFGLDKVPFSSTADPHFYINFIPHKEALEVITTALSFGESILKITGEVGTGKTLLCNKLQQQLAEQYHICNIDNAYLNAHELRCLLANKIGIEKSELEEQFLLTEKIKARLLELLAEGTRVLVLVDEAQALPDVALEALRLFSNLENDAEKLLQVVLFAQPELDVRLANPTLRQLRQRITFSYHLRALSEKEIEHYIAERLKQAGYRGAQLFSSEACRKISQSSRGIPRLINVLAHKVLILSYGQQHYEITDQLVEEAVEDTDDAYKVRSMAFWWWVLSSLALVDIILLLWWNRGA